MWTSFAIGGVISKAANDNGVGGVIGIAFAAPIKTIFGHHASKNTFMIIKGAFVTIV